MLDNKTAFAKIHISGFAGCANLCRKVFGRVGRCAFADGATHVDSGFIS